MSMLRWEHVDYGNNFHQGVWAFTLNIVMETSGQAVPRQIGWGSNSWQKQEKCKTNKKDKASNIPSMNQHSCLHLRTKRSPSLQGLLHFQTLWPLTVWRFSWRLFFINKNPGGMMWPLYSFAYWNHSVTWLNYQRDYISSIIYKVKSWYKSSKPYSCNIKN